MFGKNEPSELTLTGGTHVSTSPCFHFLDVSWRAYLERFELKLRLRMDRPGFYPRGGGVVQAFLQPCREIQSFHLLKRGPVEVSGFSAVAGLPDQIAPRQARRATVRLRQHDLEADVQEEMWEGGLGTVLALVLNTS